MKTLHQKHQFSMIEVVVVCATIALLVGTIVPVVRRAQDKAHAIDCVSHVRDISVAVQMFYNERGEYPSQVYLRDALKPYSGAGPDEYYCPTTEIPYEMFYVPRGATEQIDSWGRDNYFVGCPHHKTVACAPGKGTKRFHFGEILHNGVRVAAGSEVEDGTLTFADGSTAQLSGQPLVVASYKTTNGNLYTILRVFEDYGDTTINVSVPPNVEPRSQFEVVTPAAIAGVAGTEFEVETSVSGGESVTELDVQSGTVNFNGPYIEPFTGTVSNSHYEARAPRQECQVSCPDADIDEGGDSGGGGDGDGDSDRGNNGHRPGCPCRHCR